MNPGHILLGILAALIAVIVAPFVTALCARHLRRRNSALYANSVAEGTHDQAINKLTSAAITQRFLLYKRGADDDHIAVCAATADVPLGTVDDEAGGAEELVAVQILGIGPTKKMVASEAMVVGDEVWTTATGRVQNRNAVTGTYWILGIALTASAANDDVIEVATCAPIRVVNP
jgi:hypothetical protein